MRRRHSLATLRVKNIKTPHIYVNNTDDSDNGEENNERRKK